MRPVRSDIIRLCSITTSGAVKICQNCGKISNLIFHLECGQKQRLLNISFYKNEIMHQIDVYTIINSLVDESFLCSNAPNSTYAQFRVSHVKALKMFPLTINSLITGSLNYYDFTH